jgi:hypothetical protein
VILHHPLATAASSIRSLVTDYSVRASGRAGDIRFELPSVLDHEVLVIE